MIARFVMDNNRFEFELPKERFGRPIPRDLPLVTPEIAASRRALDAKIIPGHVHTAPEYKVLPQSESRDEQIARLGAEVAGQVIERHRSSRPTPRLDTPDTY